MKALGYVGNSGISQNRTSNIQVVNSQIHHVSQPVSNSQIQFSPQIVNSQVHTTQTHQYPQQLISQLPPGAKISGPPLSLEQVQALQRGENIRFSNQPYPGQYVPQVSVPVSGSNVETTQKRVVYQGLPSPQQIVVKETVTQQKGPETRFTYSPGKKVETKF